MSFQAKATTTSTRLTPLPIGSTLGVLGGGQLGAFFIRAAQNLGFKTAVLCPEKDCPASQNTHQFFMADYDDEEALLKLATTCDAITTEFENVPAPTLEFLAQHTRVHPCAQAVLVAQNRMSEKAFFQHLNLPTTDFAGINGESNGESNSESDWHSIQSKNLFPAIMKTTTLGYDGKGQWRVDSFDDAYQQWQRANCPTVIIEKKQTLIRELSIMVARGVDGQTACYPAVDNIHHQGILDTSLVLSKNDTSLSPLITQAQQAATSIISSLDFVGIMGVEFFVTAHGLMVNEIAPRPHNSGHYSLDACLCSQFEQQVRTLAQWPLGPTTLHHHSAMQNLLGEHIEVMVKHTTWIDLLQNPAYRLHLYGKSEVKTGRKMGHINIVGQSDEEVIKGLNDIRHCLGLPATRTTAQQI